MSIKVRKARYYDGSPLSGKPIGPKLEVIKFFRHKPVDGPGGDLCCNLSDGSWEFAHNLYFICE